jgi:DNA repair exonuclease SbcCD ATPase subunit
MQNSSGNTMQIPLSQLRSDLDRLVFEEGQVRADLFTCECALRRANREQLFTEQAQVIIRQAAVDTRQEIRIHLSDLVTAAIQSILPEHKAWEFEATFLDRGGVEFALRKGDKVRDPYDKGGGVKDIISVALRFAAWSLSQLRPVIILDEPFRNLSRTLYGEEAKKKASALLKELSRELGIQIITVTHDPDLIAEADRIFRVDQDGEEVSTVTQI